MNNSNTICIFEHTTLIVNENGFTQKHFDALVKYNDLYKGKYFRVGHKKITFKSYVGVIQVGNKVIEILPKADRNSDSNNTSKWQRALLFMLQKAGYIKLHQTEEAALQTQRANLLDIYVYTFLQEVEHLVHTGLIKKYKRIKANQTVLKGRLLMEQQLQRNLIHKERFYTDHTIYSRDIIYNQILKTALKIIKELTLNSHIQREVSKLLLHFEDVKSWTGTTADFSKLTLDRKSLPYKKALNLAEMIILNFCPNLTSGDQHVLALLFNMNVLFEKFIYRLLKNSEDEFQGYQLLVTPQNSRSFWEHKNIRPDLLITFKKNDSEYRVVIDTKWKIVDDSYPSDRDLQQMFTYNIQFDTDHAILLYPSTGQNNTGKKQYTLSKRTTVFPHACEMYFIELFENENGVINNNLGKKFINYLLHNIPSSPRLTYQLLSNQSITSTISSISIALLSNTLLS